MMMDTVLVTGGTGHLGRDIVADLKEAGFRVRVIARKPGEDPDVEWIRGDLATGEGIAGSASGARAIVNAATYSPIAVRGMRPIDLFRTPSAVDLDGTRRLMDEAARAGVGQFLHVSIIGIDDAPLPYARLKREAERAVRASSIPWTVARAAPFFYLIERTFVGLVKAPIWPLPARNPFQPVDSRDFAAYLVDAVGRNEQGTLREFAGPEILTIGEVAEQFQASRGISRRIINAPLPGPVARAVRSLFPVAASNAVLGQTTWRDWLKGREVDVSSSAADRQAATNSRARA
jgi:uncharacterized protein YbjT (DUF2867 family)